VRPVSSGFLRAVASSHRMASRVTVVSPGQNGTTPTGTVIPVEIGSVTYDTTAKILGSATVTTSQSWPVNSADLLAPYGNELFIERGVGYGDGSVEWVSLGYFRINSPVQQSSPYGSVALTCQDRMAGVIDGRIPYPVTFAAGTTVISVITSLITAIYPWAVIDYDASLSTATLNAAQTTTDDRYGFLDTLITSYGMIWYWDYRGYLYIHYPPNPNSPVFTIQSGRNGTLVTMSRTLDRTGVYNGCVASGQQATSNVPPSALVVDNNPASPTYWYGPFGQVPQFYSSSFLQTTAQCQQAAQSQMLLSAGISYELDFGFVPNPALVAYDPVQVIYLGGNAVENHILKQMVIGLAAGDAMTAQTRQLVSGQFKAI
jgi:hypothetical protein